MNILGGKSFTCLTKYLPFLTDPATRIVLLRESYPQIKVSGGLLDTSQQIYPHLGGTLKTQALKWVFPSGATIQFAAIPDDAALSGWQGSQLTHVLIDEAAEWSENQVLFLLSRMRSASFKGKLQAVLTANPSKTSFLFKWVEWCLDENGVPKHGTENRVRWFVNLNGKMLWADSPEELYETYGHGYTLGVDFIPKSFRFIPMTIYDNPILLKQNPEYLANLLAQPKVNQLRYLKGSWTATAEGAGYWKREWCEVVDRFPTETTGRVRAYDLAATVPSEANRDPDYTAGVKISRTRDGTYYVEDVYRYRKRTGDVIEEIIKTAQADGIDDCQVIVPKDSGAAGTAFNSYLVRTLAEHGIAAKTTVISGHRGKVQRFLPFASLCESGNVKIVRGDWNEEFFQELEAFDGGRKGHDDQCDSVADGFNALAKQLQLPMFVVPDLSRASLIPT